MNRYLLKKKKKVPRRDDSGKLKIETFFDNALSEIKLLEKINHPNIANRLDLLFNEENEKIYLILEYCEKGELIKVNEEKRTFFVNPQLTGEKTYSEAELKKFAFSLLSAVEYRVCLNSSQSGYCPQRH